MKNIGVLALLGLLSGPAMAEQLIEVDDDNQSEEPKVDKVCRVLSLSGGGSKGAFEVGAINYLYRNLPAPSNQYDVISGVSVGSINAFGYSMFAKGSEAEAANYMRSLWANLTNDDIWSWWSTIDKAEGLNKAGLLDNMPLYNFLLKLKKENKTLKKNVIVSAVDSDSGNYMPFDLSDKVSDEYQVSAVVGSAAMPFVFPAKSMHEFGLPYNLVDGGSTWNNNMITGIKKCFDLGFTAYNQIELDVIVLFPRLINSYDITSSTNAYDFYFRERELRSAYSQVNDIEEFMHAFPDVKYRYFIQSDTTLLPETNILRFDHVITDPLVSLGEKDAAKVVAMGPGKSFDRFRV